MEHGRANVEWPHFEVISGELAPGKAPAPAGCRPFPFRSRPRQGACRMLSGSQSAISGNQISTKTISTMIANIGRAARVI